MIRTKFTNLVPALALGTAAVLAADPALAHHPLGGAPMTTFAHGVLSGIGHPLLGFDHLFFVLLVGIAALYTGHRFTAPAAYIAAMALGSVVLSGRSLGIVAAACVFAAFGLFHGSAFGDAMATREAGAGAQVLVGYLIGLGVLQYGIAVAAGTVVLKLWKATESTAIEARLTGAVVAGIGMFLTLEHIEGFLVEALL
mgnify:CR=1 FL=1